MDRGSAEVAETAYRASSEELSETAQLHLSADEGSGSLLPGDSAVEEWKARAGRMFGL